MQSVDNAHILNDKYEEESFRNLVFFYYKELLAIREGDNTDKILSKREKATLKIKGVIGYNNSSQTWITEKALKIMQELFDART